MNRWAVVLLLVGAGSLMSGCSFPNRYARFYRANALEAYAPAKTARVYEYTPDTLADAESRGAVLLGVSSFCAPYTAPSRAARHAKRIGANLVLVQVDYRRTVSGSITVPIYHPGETTTSTTTTYGDASAYGSARASTYGTGGYGYANASANLYGDYSETSTTTIQHPGHTTYHALPYTIHYYDHAGYFLWDSTLPGLVDK